MGIIIFGASGAGSTTLGKEIAQRLKFQYLDIDDYLWCWNTKIPLTVVRSQEERTNNLMNDIKKHPNFVISGTIFSDKELFEPLFNLAVFISTPAEICAERVRIREHTRWGERVLPGGDMHKATRFHGDYDDYIANAQKYETADVSRFGRKLHEQWIAELSCPVLRVDGTNDFTKNADLVIAQFMKATG
jgi:uridine kinase